MTLWLSPEQHLVDIILEPHLEGVVTVCADSVQALFPFRHVSPEAPFSTTGGMFTWGVHIPLKKNLPLSWKTLFNQSSPEKIDSPISPEPLAWYWEATLPDSPSAEEPRAFYGFAWEKEEIEFLAEAIEFFRSPLYHVPFELLSEEGKNGFFAELNRETEE